MSIRRSGEAQQQRSRQCTVHLCHTCAFVDWRVLAFFCTIYFLERVSYAASRTVSRLVRNTAPGVVCECVSIQRHARRTREARLLVDADIN